MGGAGKPRETTSPAVNRAKQSIRLRCGCGALIGESTRSRRSHRQCFILAPAEVLQNGSEVACGNGRLALRAHDAKE